MAMISFGGGNIKQDLEGYTVPTKTSNDFPWEDLKLYWGEVWSLELSWAIIL